LGPFLHPDRLIGGRERSGIEEGERRRRESREVEEEKRRRGTKMREKMTSRHFPIQQLCALRPDLPTYCTSTSTSPSTFISFYISIYPNY
jgi:hypothetical protein